MGEDKNEFFAASACVVPGGNRLLRVVAHVVCRDPNGQVRWEDDARLEIPIPAGTEVPEFQCAAVRSEIVPRLQGTRAGRAGGESA